MAEKEEIQWPPRLTFTWEGTAYLCLRDIENFDGVPGQACRGRQLLEEIAGQLPRMMATAIEMVAQGSDECEAFKAHRFLVDLAGVLDRAGVEMELRSPLMDLGGTDGQ